MANKKCEHERRSTTCSICSPEQVFKQYEYKARQRRLRFTITLDQFTEIVDRACVFCGEQSEPRGVDRKDNYSGYVYDNCQSCCGDCNKLKSSRNEQAFLSLIFKIAKYQELQKQKSIPPPLRPEESLITVNPV